jgi:PKD repeat protein
MGRALRACVILVAADVLVAGCTVKKTTTPALAGPSELGLSLSVGATPDSIYQDGHSQSVITIQARDANGAPVQNLGLRLDITVDGVVGDVGSLTNKNPATASDGRAVVTYTAPLVGDQTSRVVAIQVTPVGTDYANNSTSRSVEIKLVPTGTVPPPNDLVAGFTLVPTAPKVGEPTWLNAAPCATAEAVGCTRGSIMSYAWDFGDGTTGTGQVVSHAFGRAGNLLVTLKVTGSVGQTATATQIVPVAAGIAPTADFGFVPAAPVVSQEVFFDASASKPGGTIYSIVSYEWDFGSGARGNGVIARTTYVAPGDYLVTLVVTDNVGQKGTKTKTVTVK